MRFRFWNGEDACSTLSSRNAGGQQRMPDKEHFNGVIGGDEVKIVRRLTERECERLQGYPDDWTLIGEAHEDGNHYYKDENGKERKVTASARYKALGNSICLPQWFALMKKISDHYEEPPTLASLFDGIGGFPLIWETLNGKGACIWASEVESFPIAVTKEHFPEDTE